MTTEDRDQIETETVRKILRDCFFIFVGFASFFALAGAALTMLLH